VEIDLDVACPDRYHVVMTVTNTCHAIRNGLEGALYTVTASDLTQRAAKRWRSCIGSERRRCIYAVRRLRARFQPFDLPLPHHACPVQLLETWVVAMRVVMAD
jgi:hypothetical protein